MSNNTRVADAPEKFAQDCSANERLILSTILAHGALPGAEVARRTGLSAQSASVITRGLEAQGMLARDPPVRGRVGKPSVPLRLNAQGALALGLKIGRRTADLVLVDFLGAVQRHEVLHYAYPAPDRVFEFVGETFQGIAGALNADQRGRLAGLGLAVPFELWNWLDRLDAPAHEMQRWKGLDLAERLTALTGLAVFPGNDGTLACAAETLFGCGSGLTDFAYFNIGSFLGGGIVLNGVVYPGRTGNAGALASLPVGPRVGAQLLETASLYALERDLIAAGYESEALWQAEDADWDRFGSVPERWIGETVQALALASVAVCSVIDFEAVVIDGRVPSQIRSRLRAGVSETLRELDTQGLVLPRIVSGTMGRRAGVVGAAYQPILRRYLHGGAGLV